MRKQLISMTLTATLMLLSTTVNAKKMKSDDLSNMVIEGENRLMVHQALPDFPWSPNLYRDVSDLLMDGSLLGSLKPPSIKNPTVPYPDEFRSPKGAMAWLADIYESPVLNLRIRPKKGEEEKKVEWVFLVKDSQGKPYYEKRAKGEMPPAIEWKGFSSKGNPLQVGLDYSYTLSIIDEAGNPQRFSGNPFRIDSFRYKKGKKEITLISPENIFADRSSAKLSSNGASLITEVRDRIRPVYNQAIVITVYDDDVKFGLSRANVLRKVLIDELDYPEQKIITKGARLKDGDGYRYVEISTN